MNKNKTGLVFGSFLAIWHLMWGIMVATGIAQPFLNFIFKIHMIANPYQVLPFNLGLMLTLIAATFILGYIFGSLIAWLANHIHTKQHML